jgi:hypothetical protein
MSLCYINNNGFLMTAMAINLYAMIIFLVVGAIVFIWVLCVYSCDDGSCTSSDFWRCWCLIVTCGLCDMGRNSKRKYNKNEANINKADYKTSRKGWIHSSKRICGCLGFGGRKQK